MKVKLTSKKKGGIKYLSVLLSSFPSEQVMELYMERAVRDKLEIITFDVPIGLKRYQFSINP